MLGWHTAQLVVCLPREYEVLDSPSITPLMLAMVTEAYDPSIPGGGNRLEKFKVIFSYT